MVAFRQIYGLAAVTQDLLPRIVKRIGSGRVQLLWLDDSYHVARFGPRPAGMRKDR
ncbi:hypothetical protein [Variovorax sp. GT1P44]|uniref:hypothetical protein n=1 Tax=Variovorax sp. GT1P44 TaxID=3443742 RepID=UPI003F48C620